MGLLYKIFGIKPTTLDEFKDTLRRKNIHDVTIKVGRVSYEKLGSVFLTSTQACIEFCANGIKLRQYHGERINNSFRWYFGAHPDEIKKEVKSNVVIMMYALQQRNELQNEGRDCKILVGENKKLLDKIMEDEWLQRAHELGVAA